MLVLGLLTDTICPRDFVLSQAHGPLVNDVLCRRGGEGREEGKDQQVLFSDPTPPLGSDSKLLPQAEQVFCQ